MMDIQEKLKIYQETQNKLTEFAEEYIKEFECAECNFDGIESVAIVVDFIEVDYGEYYSGCCGNYEGHTVNIPLSYFTDLDWKTKEQAIRLERNLVTLRKKEAEDNEKKRLQKEAEYKHFLKLKEKYDEN